jgi:hypothetical protein
VVERFFAWIGRNRRLAKDFEASIASAEAFLYAASAVRFEIRDGLSGSVLAFTSAPPNDTFLAVWRARAWPAGWRQPAWSDANSSASTRASRIDAGEQDRGRGHGRSLEMVECERL